MTRWSTAAAPLLLPLLVGLGRGAAADPGPLPTAAERVALDHLASLPPVDRFAGEALRWEVRYAGLDAGEAWYAASSGPAGLLLLEGGAASAPWYSGLFSIDDRVWSEGVPLQGSRRYRTRFREGGFKQDQDMRLSADGISVWRHQEIDGAWKAWTTSYPGHAGAEDPASAMHRLRLLEEADLGPTPVGEGWTYDVFSGEETWTIAVRLVDREVIEDEVLGAVATRVLELHTRHEGMLEQKGRFRIWLTDDARRVPVKMVVRTNFGAIRARLSAYDPPDAWSPPPSGGAASEGAAP